MFKQIESALKNEKWKKKNSGNIARCWIQIFYRKQILQGKINYKFIIKCSICFYKTIVFTYNSEYYNVIMFNK